MKAEQPAQGISKKAEFDDAVWYEVNCECGSHNHYHSLWVDRDLDTKLITVSITTESSTDFWTQTVREDAKIHNVALHWIWWRVGYAVNETVRRAKIIVRVLFKGYIKYDSTVLLTKQQAYNYAKALENSVKELEGKK